MTYGYENGMNILLVNAFSKVLECWNIVFIIKPPLTDQTLCYGENAISYNASNCNSGLLFINFKAGIS